MGELGDDFLADVACAGVGPGPGIGATVRRDGLFTECRTISFPRSCRLLRLSRQQRGWGRGGAGGCGKGPRGAAQPVRVGASMTPPRSRYQPCAAVLRSVPSVPVVASNSVAPIGLQP
jgi:hypothetical protein